MSFDLSQLLQGPARDLILGQVTKHFGLSDENSGSLLNKGLSMVLGSMAQKATTQEGASGLFDLIKGTETGFNPLDLLSGKFDLSNSANLLELGKKLLPSVLGSRAEAVTSYLANSTGASSDSAKGILGMILPIVFSFFKGKIASGLNLGSFTNLLGEQAKSLMGNLDEGSFNALGLTGNSFSTVLNNVSKLGSTLSTAGVAAAASQAASAVNQAAEAVAPKKSGAGKWVLGAAVVLAALFGLKNCSNKDAAPATQAATEVAAQQAPVAAKVDGLGDLSWVKTDKDFTVSGTVQNEGIKSNILGAFKALAGNLPLVDKLIVDAKAGQFSFENFAGLANVLKEFPGVNGAFADKLFSLTGLVNSDDAKSALVSKAKDVLGNLFSVNADGVKVSAPAATEEPEASVISDMSLSKLDLDIVFKTGSSEISPRYFNRLNALAKYLVENKRGGEIAGYTDNTGDAAANKQLSEVRAAAIREYLVKAGVPAESLTAVGYGQENPVADNSTEEGRTKNRRIEFNAH